MEAMADSLLPSLARLRLADTGGALPSKALAEPEPEPEPEPLAVRPREGDADEARAPHPAWLPAEYLVQGSGDHAPQTGQAPMARRPATAGDEVPNAALDGGNDPVDGRPVRRQHHAERLAPYRSPSKRRADRILASDVEYSIQPHALHTLSEDLAQELQRFVDEDISVTYGSAGPDGGLSKAFERGLEAPRGWVVVATSTDTYVKEVTVHTDVETKIRKVVVPANSTVGVLLVAASEEEWSIRRARSGRSANLVTLAVHDAFLGNYVHEALWQSLKETIKTSGDTNTGTFTLSVQGGPCLNNHKTRAIYARWGFGGVYTDFINTAINGWSLAFTDGVPRALPGENGESVEELVKNVRVPSPLRRRAFKQ